MVSVSEVLDDLSATEIKHLVSSPSMREAFIAEMADEYDVNSKELEGELLIKGEEYISDEEEALQDIPLKIVTPMPQWNLGGDFRTQQKKGQIMKEILDLLAREGGRSKTQMLKELNKDNITWREITQEVLEYLKARDMIVKVTNKYYSRNNQSFRESPIHRKIYSLLCESPHTTSSLLRGIGYNNPKGKVKLMQALSIMEQENLIRFENRYWGLAV